ncbi:MAG: hypothetical protein AB1778_01310 [Candidatus Bipolaricaulota bacterium]
MLFAPAMNSTIYYFFTQHRKLAWSHSVLRGITVNPYGRNPVYMMGELWAGTPFSMNVGYLADGYMNLGLPGVILMSGLLGVVLIGLDSVARRLPVSLAIGAIALPIRNLVDAALLTTLATHGLLIGAAILRLLPRPRAAPASSPAALHAAEQAPSSGTQGTSL